LVPSRMGGSGPIWRERIPAAEIARRIAEVHRPYHDAVAAALAAARRRYGIAVLLDCHSMPPRADPEHDAQIVIGDRYATSCAPHLVAAAEQAIRAAGYTVARNAPYAGGHITTRHGRPQDGIHALQIELDRSLYLGPDLRTPGTGFEPVAECLAALVRALTAISLSNPESVAAE
jgi:N-formylglutamate amidohydrolase